MAHELASVFMEEREQEVAMMLRSMTGFAREQDSGEWGSASWELRSVNSRYLDVTLRLPEELRSLDPAIREAVGSKLTRGKIDCVLRYQAMVSDSNGLRLNLGVAKAVAAASRELEVLFENTSPISTLEVLRWPGVVESAGANMGEVGKAILGLLAATLDDLVAARTREGSAMGTTILERCGEVESIAARVRARQPQMVEAARARLGARLEELRAKFDPARLEQEIVLLAQKMDVAEELDRLDSHVAEVRRVLNESKPAGRRLDFLLQEMNREANTIASKSQDSETTRGSVDLKVLIEQMREQVQNVE